MKKKNEMLFEIYICIIYKYIYLLFGGIDRNLILNLVC